MSSFAGSSIATADKAKLDATFNGIGSPVPVTVASLAVSSPSSGVSGTRLASGPGAAFVFAGQAGHVDGTDLPGGFGFDLGANVSGAYPTIVLTGDNGTTPLGSVSAIATDLTIAAHLALEVQGSQITIQSSAATRIVAATAIDIWASTVDHRDGGFNEAMIETVVGGGTTTHAWQTGCDLAETFASSHGRAITGHLDVTGTIAAKPLTVATPTGAQTLDGDAASWWILTALSGNSTIAFSHLRAGGRYIVDIIPNGHTCTFTAAVFPAGNSTTYTAALLATLLTTATRCRVRLSSHDGSAIHVDSFQGYAS